MFLNNLSNLVEKLEVGAKKFLKRPAVILLIYVIIALAFFSKWFLLSDENRRYVSGDFYQYFSSFYYYAKSLRHLSLPLWDQYVYQGIPIFAKVDTAFLYPINLLWIIIGAITNLSLTKLFLFYEAYPIVHLALGGFFTFLLARDFRISRLGSFLAGLLFMLSGNLVIMVSGPTLVASLVWFPLALLYFRRILANGDPYWNKKYIIVLAIIIALSHFAGYFQISFFYNLFGLLLYLAYWSLTEKKSLAKTLRQLLYLIIAVSISILLYSIQLLPTLELMLHSTRSTNTLESATFYGAVKPLDVLNFVFPNFYRFYNRGFLINIVPIYAYFGFLTILLFIFGLKVSKSVKAVGYFVLLLILALIAAFGGYSSLYDYLVLLVPGLIKFRNIFKILYLASLSVSMVAAFGFDYVFSLKDNIQKKMKNPIRVFVIVLLIMLGLQIIIFYFRFISHQRYLDDIFAIEAVGNTIMLSLVLISVAIIILYYGVLWNRFLAKILIILFVVIDLSLFNQFSIVNNSKISPRFFLLNDNIRAIDTIANDHSVFRVKFIGTGFGSFYFPEGLKLKNMDGYSSFTINKFGEASDRANGLSFNSQEFVDEISRAGVKYVISDQPINNPRLIKFQEDEVSLESRKYFFTLVDDAHNFTNRNPGEKIFSYQNLSFKGLVETQVDYVINEWGDKEIRIDFNSAADETATVKTPYYNGWVASLNSKRIKIGQNNDGYMVINLPKGKSNLVLRYLPSSTIYVGLIITLIISIAIALYYLRRIKPRMRKVPLNEKH